MYIHILKHVFLIGKKSNVPLKPTRTNDLYLDHCSKRLIPLGIHNVLLDTRMYLIPQTSASAIWLQRENLKTKCLWFIYFKPVDQASVSQLITVLFNTICMTFLELFCFCYFNYLFYSHFMILFFFANLEGLWTTSPLRLCSFSSVCFNAS